MILNLAVSKRFKDRTLKKGEKYEIIEIKYLDGAAYVGKFACTKSR